MEIATYIYRRKEGYPVAQLVRYTLKVEVLEELKGERLRVKFLGYHADGRTPGTVTVVKAKNVKRISAVEVASRSGKSADLAELVRNLNIDTNEIRKPYKDD